MGSLQIICVIDRFVFLNGFDLKMQNTLVHIESENASFKIVGLKSEITRNNIAHDRSPTTLLVGDFVGWRYKMNS